MSMVLKLKIPAWMVEKMEEQRGEQSPATFVMTALKAYTMLSKEATAPHGEKDAEDKNTVRTV